MIDLVDSKVFLMLYFSWCYIFLLNILCLNFFTLSWFPGNWIYYFILHSALDWIFACNLQSSKSWYYLNLLLQMYLAIWTCQCEFYIHFSLKQKIKYSFIHWKESLDDCIHITCVCCLHSVWTIFNLITVHNSVHFADDRVTESENKRGWRVPPEII